MKRSGAARARTAARALPPAPAARPRHVDVDRINYINIGLMLGSAALACTLPFEIFLISYAVLGPLHYLTQISWLWDRGFYTTGRFDGVPLALLAAVALLSFVGWIDWDGAALTALGGGVLAAFVSNPVVKAVGFGAFAVAAASVLSFGPAEVLFVVLLATVVHVYVFTGLFILAGSLRSGSLPGYLSLAVYVACGVGLLVVQTAAAGYQISQYVADSIGPFGSVVGVMMWFIPGDGEWPATVAVGRFLAFAYTYHYLNWFSKTEIIRWHDASRTRLAGIGIVWVASLVLYGWDYRIGLTALYFLSVAHVFLEFPLDARTLVELFGGARRLRTA